MNFKALIFVLLYFVALLKPVAPLIDYAINQEYIAEMFCINKDKPELQCNGKCHLAKKLNKSNESKRKVPQINMKEYPVGFVSKVAVLYSFSNNLSVDFYYFLKQFDKHIKIVEFPPDSFV